MAHYLSTFASGMQDFIKDLLGSKLNNVNIVKVLDGAMVYGTSSDPSTIKELRFFNNSFAILKTFENSALEEMARSAFDDRNVMPSIKNLLEKETGRTFRLIFSNENRLVPMDPRIVKDLESRISRLRLKPDRSSPQIEFWFLKRSEGMGFFMIRLTKHRAYEKVLQKGELRPEISNVAVLLSEPNKGDFVLDPFFGHGSLILERSKYPFQRIIAIDNEPKKVFDLRQKIRGKNVRIEKSDSLNIEKIPANQIDKIITDPPWGLFKKVNLGTFYEGMIRQFSRILKPGGIIILLTSQKELVEKIILRYKTFKIEKRYDILISGQKAGLYKIRKA